MSAGAPMAATEPVRLAREYREQLLRNGRGHYKAAEAALRKHRMVGGLTALLSAGAGSTLLSSSGDLPRVIAVAAGVAGLVVSAMAGLQTFLNYGEIAAQHTGAGRRFASLRKEFDVLIIKLEQVGDVEAQLAQLEDLRARWEQASTESPLIPRWADRKAARELAKDRQSSAGAPEDAGPNGTGG